MTGHTNPAPIVPTPAALYPRLRGLRVIVGVPGIGFRADLRADDPVVQGSRTFVPILTEQDYYRAETDQIETFAPLVPVERVWVEHVSDQDAPHREATMLDAPAVQEPIPALSARRVMGSRVAKAVPDGHIRSLRAVTDVYLNASGLTCLRICAERDWYVWAVSGAVPPVDEVEAASIWVE
jgi:hypothetical protein